ncbi:MAG: helix-turn-helix transcriptional regulator [Sporichthyaceae bacterium]
MTAADRLTRLLALVPYLINRQGIELAKAAADAGISETQLVKDLELLFLCGLPGHLPGDLIEADWESGRVYLTNADTIGRPLRLRMDEVTALVVGLRVLAGLPGAAESQALERALAKLTEIAGGAVGAVDAQVGVETTPVDPTVAEGVRRGLEQRRRLHLRYWVPWRDEVTERDVDPMRLALVDGHSYLEGWCHRAEAVRLFRLDRVLALDVLDVPAEVPADAPTRDLSAGLFQPGTDDVVATLRLDRGARWVSEYYPGELVSEEADGTTVVRLRAPDPAWVVALALRLGPSAQIIDPPGLAEQVREHAREALEAYGEPVTESSP